MPIHAAMDLPPALLQFLGSLVAILALAAFARALKLGSEPRIASIDEARRAADEAVSGFDPIKIGLDDDGRSALLMEAEGRILLLRPHGSHLAGRILTAAARARIEEGTLVVDTAEKRYGAARLRLADPSAWMQAIEAIED